MHQSQGSGLVPGGPRLTAPEAQHLGASSKPLIGRRWPFILTETKERRRPLPAHSLGGRPLAVQTAGQ